MNTIEIDKKVLEEKINKLKQLRDTCEGLNVKPEDIRGSGQSIGMLAKADAKYQILKDSILQLLDNSILFFDNVKNSLVSADEKASEKIK